MTYTVKEIFKTVQGEGAWTGRVAVFCRFAGCNLWSGREEDRASAICKFCDTDFVGGTKYAAPADLADAVQRSWGRENYNHRFVVLTGGEPALQFDSRLRAALKARGFFIAIETNGTVALKAEPDWTCVSPKAGTHIVTKRADELKVVYPQIGLDPEDAIELVDADYYSLQPMDGPRLRENTADLFEYVLDHPNWRFGNQMHKTIGVA